ncbi:hypothetical protein ACFVRU_23770 [Streptomyces sp. NPDC057927]
MYISGSAAGRDQPPPTRRRSTALQRSAHAALRGRASARGASGIGARGGLDTASAAAHDAKRSRIDTPPHGCCTGASRSEADMDASWGFGGKRG